MLAQIVEADFLITAEASDADVVVINTCGFIAPAKAEALEAIEHAVKFKTIGSVKKVIVTGCLSERLGSRLLEQANGIDAMAYGDYSSTFGGSATAGTAGVELSFLLAPPQDSFSLSD